MSEGYEVPLSYLGDRWYIIKNTEINRHHTVDPMMLSASGNLFKCHEEVLYLQPLIPPKRFDIFFPIITGGCSEGLGVF